MNKKVNAVEYPDIEIALYKKGAKHSSFIAISTIIGLFLGFIPQVIVAKKLGLGMATDAYLMALSINQIIIKIFRIGTLPKIFIMAFSDDFVNDRKKTESNFNNFFNILFVLSLLVIIFVYFLAPLLANIIAKGYDIPKKHMTIGIIRLLLPLFSYQCIISLGESIFKLHNEFSRWARLSLLPPFIVFMFVCFYISKYSIYSVVWGTLIGSSIHLLFILYFIYFKFKYSYHFEFNLKHGLIKKSVHLLSPYYLSSIPVQLNLSIQSFFASLLPEGLSSVFFYACRIIDYVEQFSVNIFAQIILPYFSKKIIRAPLGQIKKIYNQIMCFTNYVHLPLLVILAILGNQSINILFSNKFTDAKLILILGVAFSWLIIFILPEPAMSVQSNIILAMKRTMFLNMVNISRTIVTIFFNIILFRYFQIWGLIFSNSLSYFQGFLMNQWNLQKKYSFENILTNPRFLKIIFLNMALAAFCYSLNYFIIHNFILDHLYNKIFAIGIVGTSGLIFYIICSYLFRSDEIKILLSLVTNRKS